MNFKHIGQIYNGSPTTHHHVMLFFQLRLCLRTMTHNLFGLGPPCDALSTGYGLLSKCGPFNQRLIFKVADGFLQAQRDSQYFTRGISNKERK